MSYQFLIYFSNIEPLHVEKCNKGKKLNLWKETSPVLLFLEWQPCHDSIVSKIKHYQNCHERVKILLSIIFFILRVQGIKHVYQHYVQNNAEHRKNGSLEFDTYYASSV